MIKIARDGVTRGTPKSEKQFAAWLRDADGILVTGIEGLDKSKTYVSREMDGIFITPRGIYAIEVKGTGASGVLKAPSVDAWSVGGDRNAFTGRPGEQAASQARIVGSVLWQAKVRGLRVPPVAAIIGRNLTLHKPTNGSNGRHMFADGVHIVLADEDVADVLAAHVYNHNRNRVITVETVRAILKALGCLTSAPSDAAIRAEGFPTEAEALALVTERQQQIRAEYERAVASRPSLPTEPAPIRPAADVERHRHNLDLDPELTIVGAIVDGVAFHRNAVAAAERLEVSLSELAHIVNTVEPQRGASGNVDHYIDGVWDLSVRPENGLVVIVRTAAEQEALRNGVTVDGFRLSGSVVTTATKNGISLEAVVRIVTDPEESWQAEHNRNTIHSRCDFAVVLDPDGVTIISLLDALSVRRGKDVESDIPANAQEVWLDGVCVRGSALERLRGRRVSAEQITEAFRSNERWHGHARDTSVHLGSSIAVIVNGEGAVTATTSREDALRYRDGYEFEGWRLSGKAMFLISRHRASLQAVIEQVVVARRPLRSPGGGNTVYYGPQFGVVVVDSDHTITSLMSADDMRHKIQEGILVDADAAPNTTLAGFEAETAKRAADRNAAREMARIARLSEEARRRAERPGQTRQQNAKKRPQVANGQDKPHANTSGGAEKAASKQNERLPVGEDVRELLPGITWDSARRHQAALLGMSDDMVSQLIRVIKPVDRVRSDGRTEQRHETLQVVVVVLEGRVIRIEEPTKGPAK